MDNQDFIGHLLRTYPREIAKVAVLGIFGLLCSIATAIGLVTYLWLGKKVTWKQWIVWAGIVALVCSLAQFYLLPFHTPAILAHQMWWVNSQAWVLLGQEQYASAAGLLFVQGFNFLIGLPLCVTACLSLTDLFAHHPHRQMMQAIKKGNVVGRVEIAPQVVDESLTKLAEGERSGTLLGVSMFTGEPVILPDKVLNQILLVLGTTGGGKTITLRRFYRRAIEQGYPLIIVDGKPTEENVAWVQALCQQYGRVFHGFNCGNHESYDALSNGGYTELKDKIISLKDEWENDYYRSIAEDYLQTTFEVLIKSNEPFDLKKIAGCLSYDELVGITRKTKDADLMERVKGLSEYEHKDIKGLQAHLHLLIHSELGNYLKVDQGAFNLNSIMQQGEVIYFALPALRFPSFSKVLGKLIINDIKAVIDREPTSSPIFMNFDEFSVFAGPQVLNLVNMGRGKGVHAVFGTQGLADLQTVDDHFKSQVLNCVNTIICHRLNDQDSAEEVSMWVGTKDAFTVTAQLNMNNQQEELGNVSLNKEYIVHPDGIKQQLRTGEAYLVSKVDGFKEDKVKIKFG